MVGEVFPKKDVVDSYAKCSYESEIEIISMNDERLKVLGEALSNDTSRAILSCIFQGRTTTGEIATALNLSLPLVVYHIERLLKTNIIRIVSRELNSKGREKKVYGTKKAAIFIQLNPNDADLRRKLRKLFLLSTAVAAIGVASAIWQAINQGRVEFVLSDPEDFLAPVRPLVPLIISGVGGAASVALAWAIGWLRYSK